MIVESGYGMFSEEGNERVNEAIKNALHHIESLDEITTNKVEDIAWEKLERVYEEDKFSEARDTMVREAYFVTLEDKLREIYDLDFFPLTTREEEK